MFFDCTALLAGLVATVVSKWPPNDRFSYGLVHACSTICNNGMVLLLLYSYVRAEVIAGFVNALFLLFIAFFIFAEAIEVSRTVPLSSSTSLQFLPNLSWLVYFLFFM